MLVKGIVHKAKKILSSFIHPHVIPKNMLSIFSGKRLFGSHNESQWDPVLFWGPQSYILWTFFEILVVIQKKKKKS